ncbi:WD40 repeat-like protein [Trichodelitschia bisporula]|uniref:Ribosome assembly protein 4 n=1 Tax=Trichodelitschia bisporula TaxID=703511 RepID=A0A6G1IBI6_9PEZI|nr:WD40 repeat-like protein [Trichodelitschia bisporula]
MATVVPPPSKRQKREAAEHASRQQELEVVPEGSIRVQFVDRANNEPRGPAVSVPLSQAHVKNLGILLNSLLGVSEAHERIPYRFFHEHKRGTEDEEVALADNVDIYTSLVKPGKASTEEELVLSYSPQAVFRVRAVSRCASSVSGHGEPILAAQFSPASSSRLLTGSGDSTARVWDCETGTPLFTLQGHTSWVLCVAYSPDNTLIATGSNDKSVRIWEAKTGKALGGAMKGHTAFVRSLCWEPYHLQDPGRPRVASSSKDSTVRVWDVVSKTADIILTGHKASVSCVRWGGTGMIYTSSQDKTIKVWDAKDGRLIHTLQGHAHWVNHLALSTDFILRTGFYDHTGAVPPEADRAEGAKNRFIKAATINNKVVERLVSASDDNVIFIWDPLGETPSKPVARLLGHQKQVNHVTFSPDGLYIASASFDNSVKLWSAKDGKFILTFRGHVAPVYQCSFSPDSRLLVSGSKDTTLKCWDVRTGKIVSDLPGHLDEVYAVDWSPDGQRVGSGGKDKAVRIWRH